VIPVQHWKKTLIRFSGLVRSCARMHARTHPSVNKQQEAKNIIVYWEEEEEEETWGWEGDFGMSSGW
jgi:hypothetical protein